jgi:hypothetical protein
MPDFAKLMRAMPGVVVKLERRRTMERTAPGQADARHRQIV